MQSKAMVFKCCSMNLMSAAVKEKMVVGLWALVATACKKERSRQSQGKHSIRCISDRMVKPINYFFIKKTIRLQITCEEF